MEQPPQLTFTPLPGKSVRRGGETALQVGLGFRHLPKSASPATLDQPTRFCAMKLVPSFGTNGFSIRNAKVRLVLLGSGSGPFPCVYDKFPRRKEELSQSTLEIGLQSDSTWIVGVSADIVYRTEIRRINTVLSTGGIMIPDVWWNFERRKGESALLGDSDLYLTIMSLEKIAIRGKLHFTGQLGLGRQIELRHQFRIDAP